MPRFDPSYIVESDGTRLREAQHALVNPRGHYLGAAPRSAALSRTSLKNLSPAQKRQAVKNNKSKILAEFRAKGVTNVTVNDDGTLHLKDFASDLDAAARALLNTSAPTFKLANDKATAGPPAKPIDVINALPLSAEQKRALTEAPFSTAFNAATMILTVLNNPQTGVITNVLKKTGSTFDLSTFPFNIRGATRFDISLVQPGDELFDDVSQAKMLRLRTLTAFVVLFWRKWAELHAELANQGFDWLFAKEDIVLVKTTGTEVNTPETAYVVDRIPNAKDALARGRGTWFERIEFPNRVVFRVQTPTPKGYGESRYYRMSPKGNLDRAVEMQRQWDQKYEAYKNDKITNAAGVIFYGPRMTFLRTVKGKTEAQARNIIASEDNFPRQFAETKNLPTQFLVLFDRPDLGGGLDYVNGPRPSDAGIRKLRNAAAASSSVSGLGNYVPPSGLGEVTVAGFVAVMASIEAFCVAVGPVVTGLIVVGGLLVVALGMGLAYNVIMAAMGRESVFSVDVKEGTASGGQAEKLPDEAFTPGGGGAGGKGGGDAGGKSGGDTGSGEIASASDNTLLYAGAAAALLFLVTRK